MQKKPKKRVTFHILKIDEKQIFFSKFSNKLVLPTISAFFRVVAFFLHFCVGTYCES